MHKRTARRGTIVRPRRGVTLIELMISLLLVAVIGAALLKLLLVHTNFIEREGAARAARTVSRASLNRVATDLRMVDASTGIVAASSDSITVRVPFDFGVICGTTGGATVVSMLPADSVLGATSPVGGYAYRDSTGTYNYSTGSVAVVSADSSPCHNVGIVTLTSSGGQVVGFQPTMPSGAKVGAIMFRYRTVTYKFAASTTVSGRRALYRSVSGGTTEEIAGPFSTSARFKYFSLTSATSSATIPSPLSNMRGVELDLYGQSEWRPVGDSVVTTAPVVTAIFFHNRVS